MSKRVVLVFLSGVVMIFFIANLSFAKDCPQPRKTQKVAEYDLKNTMTSKEDKMAGKKLYFKTAKPVVCVLCHGERGKGDGKIGKAFRAPKGPRNFTCKETMAGVTEGQMFGITKHGSPGTGMASHKKTLTDEQIWQIVTFITEDLMFKR